MGKLLQAVDESFDGDGHLVGPILAVIAADQTQMAIDEYLRLTGRKPCQLLFAGRDDRVELTAQ